MLFNTSFDESVNTVLNAHILSCYPYPSLDEIHIFKNLAHSGYSFEDAIDLPDHAGRIAIA